ncbi:Ephexin-1 [Papilio machaon]|uniref:Ephexin-1 n=1 Tax=Papilio machaon TaxID=76193 RepID=A0A194QRK3_PAPMA|nr:Ephexin-1 [Papilio machaon]
MVSERSPKYGVAPPLPARPRTFRRNCGDQVSVTSPTKVYIETSVKSAHYSANDEQTGRRVRRGLNDDFDDRVTVIKVLEQTCWLCIRTVLQDGEIEIQDLVAFIDGDSSDSGHFYESLEPAPPVPAHPTHMGLVAHDTHVAHTAHAAHGDHASASHMLPLEDDFDSFDSDTDSEDHDQTGPTRTAPEVPSSRLPTPPNGGGPYTLTKIANAAQKKMRQIKRNLTKRYTVAMDGKPFTKASQQNGTYDLSKPKMRSPIYANCERPEPQPNYTNIAFNDSRNLSTKSDNTIAKVGFKEEGKPANGDKRHSNGDVGSPQEKPTTPTNETKKDTGTLSRKTYFSFKSRFRRASSMAVDLNSEVPSALKITNSTFYLTDSMDGDSGFSNCSDSGATNTDTLSASSRRRDGTRAWAESSPCLAPPLERPAQPPPPPPTVPPAPHLPPAPPVPPAPRTPHAPQPPHVPPAPHTPHTPHVPHTDLSAVNEELKRLLPTLSRKDKGPRTRTSWYAECEPAQLTTTPSWYSEAGLYQGNASSSSGASSGSHPASPLPQPHSLFTHEPLYQFYNAAKVESACRESGDSDSDGYEASAVRARPSAMALVAPRGPARTLWCEVPEVLNSAVLSSLAPAQKRLQEAKFEVLTSEASYLNSLNVLEAHFISHPAFRDPHVLPPHDWDTLFSTILPVRKCSQLLMMDLEKCWQENILLQDICDIVRRHAEARFHAYVKYCENQVLMVRALQRLRDRPAFANALKRLESHPACQSLSLHSFLMLPMQRVTRLPLLLDAVLRNLQPADREYDGCMHALATLNDFVSQCNEGARNTERVEEMFRLAAAIEFPSHAHTAPLLGPACSRRDRKPIRWLVRSGEMTQLIWKADELKLTFGKKFHKVPLHLFLFNDLLVVTKKKGEESYLAVDWCTRSLLEVCEGAAAPPSAKHALLLTLLENRDARTVEMVMSCPSETDLSRWSEALAPLQGGAGEAVYAGWDCPQVAALYAYAPAQPDELPLAEGDVVNVTRKTSEGWYYGERTRDGEAGWFPGSYTVEIASAHVRARNLRQRYRLLALSGTYLGHRKRAP